MIHFRISLICQPGGYLQSVIGFRIHCSRGLSVVQREPMHSIRRHLAKGSTAASSHHNLLTSDRL